MSVLPIEVQRPLSVFHLYGPCTVVFHCLADCASPHIPNDISGNVAVVNNRGPRLSIVLYSIWLPILSFYFAGKSWLLICELRWRSVLQPDEYPSRQQNTCRTRATVQGAALNERFFVFIICEFGEHMPQFEFAWGRIGA